jgi:outer membrane protein assembly factor BamD (BamD/ComL family)
MAIRFGLREEFCEGSAGRDGTSPDESMSSPHSMQIVFFRTSPGRGVAQGGRRATNRGRAARACLLVLLAVFGFGPVGGSVRAADVLPVALEQTPPLADAAFRDQVRAEVDLAWLETLAGSAMGAGFYAIAEGFHRQALDTPGIAAERRLAMGLGLTTALLAQSKTDEAARLLESLSPPDNAAWDLRRALLAFQRDEFDVMGSVLERLAVDDLERDERAWFHFLRAERAERAGRRSEADGAYEEALAGATSSAQAAVFRLAQLQSRLRAGEATEGLAAQLRRQMEEAQGQRIGFQYGLGYAVVLQALGRGEEAVAVLTRQRDLLPPAEADLRDQTLLVLGLIGLTGADPARGRQAFRELLVQGQDVVLQRAALLRLAAATSTQGVATTAGLRQFYDQLLARTPAHPLFEELLFFSAELALRNGDLVRAESDVESLLTRYPGTALRSHALAVLASAAWLGERYRNAASHVAQLRAIETDPRQDVALAALQGECFYRAGLQTGSAADFRNAGEAYAAAERSREASGVEENVRTFTTGTLLYQRVMSAIRAGDLNGAGELLDAAGTSSGEDAESRWQAHWNLLRAMQAAGEVDAAARRVERLADIAEAPAGLRLRFLWLSAQLSLDTGNAADTAARVARVLAFLQEVDPQNVERSVRAEVASNAALLAAQARMETGETEEGVAAMEALRRDYPGSRAALYSFVVQARYLEMSNQIVEAQRLLTRLADEHRDSEYAPLALYEAALLAERRGQDAFLIEATQLLDRMAREFPDERHQFPARFKQAEISRKLLRFAAAEQLYLFLESAFPGHPEQAFVQLALADTLLAQSTSAPGKFEGAITRLERLAVLPGADADLRAEAGHMLGLAWSGHGNPDRAALLYWEVYERFLGAGTQGRELGARGRYWLSRTLFDLARIEEAAGRRDNARRAYEAVLRHGLPGERLARGSLGSFQSGG